MSKAVHIGGKEYPYKIGAQELIVWLPNGKRHVVQKDLVEELVCNGPGGWALATPRQVKEYLERFVLDKSPVI